MLRGPKSDKVNIDPVSDVLVPGQGEGGRQCSPGCPQCEVHEVRLQPAHHQYSHLDSKILQYLKTKDRKWNYRFDKKRVTLFICIKKPKYWFQFHWDGRKGFLPMFTFHLFCLHFLELDLEFLNMKDISNILVQFIVEFLSSKASVPKPRTFLCLLNQCALCNP